MRIPIKSKLTNWVSKYPLSVIEGSSDLNKSPLYYVERTKDEIRTTLSIGKGLCIKKRYFSEYPKDIAEFVIQYYSLPKSIVVDPFGGRATRGIVTKQLGRQYYGYEISPMNHKRVIEHYTKYNIPFDGWYLEDGTLMKSTPDNFADLVFTCPPYYNVEQYEDVPGQLSTLSSYEEFLNNIKVAAQNVYRVLKPGAFAVWQVGDFRTNGQYRAFHVDVVNIFTSVGLSLHDVVVSRYRQENDSYAIFTLFADVYKIHRYTARVNGYLCIFTKPGEYVEPKGIEEDDFLINGNHIDKWFDIDEVEEQKEE